MKFLDLFAGIGGFRLGMEQAGHECVGYVEIDKYARKSYEAIHDTEEEWTAHDITTVTDDDLEFLGGQGIDVICGGFPCQTFSVAGKRGGFGDTRGTLFFEIARAAKEIKPRILLLENVKGLISHDGGKTLDVIVKTLNDIGYRVDFNVLNSKYFGVPQNRERIFLVGIREDLVENEPWRIDAKDKTVVPKGKRRISGYDDVKTFNFDWPAQEEVTTRLHDILEPGVDEKYYLSEEKTAALVAQLDEGLAVKEASGVNHGVVEPKMVGHVDIKGHDAIKRVYSAEGVSPTVTTMGGGHREPKIAEEQVPKWIPKPDGVNRTLRSGGKASLSDKHNYDHIAEEVRPVLTPERLNKQQNGRRFKGDGEESFTLTSQDRQGVLITGASLRKRENMELEIRKDGLSNSLTQNVDHHLVKDSYRIRKLTPKECWRLQGFPDWAFQKAEQVNSNSQLYKQAGNSVTINVVYELAKRLKEDN